MPDREVKTIRDQIFFQYAKIIAKAAFGPDAKKTAYGFIKSKFHELRDNEMVWSDILREDKQLVEAEKACVYCGSKENLSWEHIVPKSLLVNERCPACDHIQGIHNQVWACKSCNSRKSTRGLYHFYQELLAGDGKFYDHIPELIEKKYLKTIYLCHRCKGDLESTPEGITVLDLDF